MGISHLPELVIILVIALIVFGPQRLPEVSRSLGRAVNEFRRATSELQEQMLQPHEPDPQDDFPHIPPDPQPSEDAPASVELTPTIDTLAQRREARQRRQAAAQAAASTTAQPETDPVDDAPSTAE